MNTGKTNVNMGVFPIPNDTLETSTLLSGIDAALSVSAKAKSNEKEAALAFLEFISRTENAQIFCDSDGAPSTITAVKYSDPRVDPVINKMKSGPLHDWFASTIPIHWAKNIRLFSNPSFLSPPCWVR
jgi:raffinose/stachyose/melibiose transport system substrate-binding protein